MTGVVVVGAGVIGLTCAIELARHGNAVTVVADQPPHRTVSAVAAAIWEPYDAYPRGQVLRWSMASLAEFQKLATDPESGVFEREGVVLHRDSTEPAWWTRTSVGARAATSDELVDGAASGDVCTVPVIVMPIYLEWLLRRCTALGVAFEWRNLRSLDEVGHGACPIVVAAGLRSGELTGDTQLQPVRGQLVRLTNPGLTRWYLDDDNPAGTTYIVPRVDDVICGGTNEPGETGAVPDSSRAVPDSSRARAILERSLRLEPRLAEATVLANIVGFRPGRGEVRIDSTEHGGRSIVHCYGHGGAGVTTSWGAAREVTALVSTAVSSESNPR